MQRFAAGGKLRAGLGQAGGRDRDDLRNAAADPGGRVAEQ